MKPEVLQTKVQMVG